eukprot:g2923.t1
MAASRSRALLCLCLLSLVWRGARAEVDGTIVDPEGDPQETSSTGRRRHGSRDGSAVEDDEQHRWIKPGEGNIDLMEVREDDPIEVYYMEHVLAAWVLESAPWTAFHSGIGFHNLRTNAKFTVDYIPVRINSVHYVLVPVLHPKYPVDTLAGTLKNWWYGHKRFEWLNDGAVMFYNDWPSKYENFTKLGKVTGGQYTRYMHWASKYNETHKTFDPVEIVVEGRDPHNATKRITKDRVSSRMCHDLVSDSLWYFYEEEGVVFEPEAPVYRDHIILFGEKYSKVDITQTEQLTAVTNYIRLYYEFLPLIEKEFTNIRGMLVNSEAGGLEPFLYIGKEYYRVTMQDPFVNYCYMPMPMPPTKPNFFEDPSFCALEQKLSTNATRTFLQSKTEGLRLMFKLGLVQPSQYLPMLAGLLGVLWLLRRLGRGGKPADAKDKKKGD